MSGEAVVQLAIEAGKRLMEFANASKNGEFIQKASEAHSAAMLAAGEAITLREENFRLRRELDAANERRNMRHAMKRDENVYYLDPVPPGSHVGPYCMLCFDDNDKLISLRPEGAQGNGRFSWKCLKCGKYCGSSMARKPEGFKE